MAKITWVAKTHATAKCNLGYYMCVDRIQKCFCKANVLSDIENTQWSTLKHLF